MRFSAALILAVIVCSSLFTQQMSKRTPQVSDDPHRGHQHKMVDQDLRDPQSERPFGRIQPEAFQGEKPPSTRKNTAVRQLTLPDTVIVYATTDTSRYTFTYDANGNVLTYLEERWDGTQLVISVRVTYTYDANGNILTFLREYWDGAQWVPKNIYVRNNPRAGGGIYLVAPAQSTWSYDGNGNMLTELHESWDGAQLVNYRRCTWTYDANGNMLTALYEAWDDTQWVSDNFPEYGRKTWTYDANGNMLTFLQEYWDAQAYHTTYTYDGSGNMLTALYEAWDGMQWVSYNFGYGRQTWTYDGSGNMLTQLQEQWDGTQWVNGERHTWTFDGNGNKLTQLQEQWDSSQWVNGERHTWTYDGNGNMLTQLQEQWDGTQWVNGERHTWTYDANGNMLTELSEYSDGTQLVIPVRVTYTYDANGNMLTFLQEYWDGAQWVPGHTSLHLSIGKNTYDFWGYHVILHYAEITTSASILRDGIAALYELTQNYPNPFNPTTTLQYSVPARSNVSLTIYNTLGQRVAQFDNKNIEAGTYAHTFDAPGLPSGLYFYRMEAASVEDPKNVFVQTKKMMLLK